MKKLYRIGLTAVPVALCAGCVIMGHDTSDPETQKQGVDLGTRVLQTVATVTGQGWAAPLIGALGGVIAGALNAHHGLRNVTVATAKGVGALAVGAAKLAVKPFSNGDTPKV